MEGRGQERSVNRRGEGCPCLARVRKRSLQGDALSCVMFHSGSRYDTLTKTTIGSGPCSHISQCAHQGLLLKTTCEHEHETD